MFEQLKCFQDSYYTTRCVQLEVWWIDQHTSC